MGENVLNDVLAFLAQEHEHRIAQGLRGETRNEWLRLGEMIFAWCCGAQRVSAI
jgi:hypothetical protein